MIAALIFVTRHTSHESPNWCGTALVTGASTSRRVSRHSSLTVMPYDCKVMKTAREKGAEMHRLILRHVRTGTVAAAVAVWLAGALGLGLATSAGAVPTATLMALGPLLGGLLLLLGHNL